jgi:7-cyano-7-deazaguanine synthase
VSVALLLSGGLDSIALAYWKNPQLAITIDYGQRVADAEIRAASTFAKEVHLDHRVVRVNHSSLGSGDLSGKPPLSNAPASEWWPFRNQMLLTLAAMSAIGDGINTLIVGSVREDRFHSDGSPEFYARINALLSYQEGKIGVQAPAIELSSVELITKSKIPFDLLCWAHSCHMENFACGFCRGCQKHYRVMKDLGHDPF